MSKQELRKFINQIKEQRARKDEAQKTMSSLQEEQTKALAPVLEKIVGDLGEKAKSAIEAAVANIKVDIPPIEIPAVNVQMPEIPTPQVTVNPPKVNVQMPEVRIPETKFPETKFPDMMRVMMDGVDNKRPLPVMMYGVDGKPFQFSIPAGASGGKGDFFTIKGYSQSAFAELQNPDGRLKVELPTGSSGLTDNELRASSVPVAQASGATWSTNVVDAFGSTAVGSVFNPDNRIRVSVETGGSGLTDSELRASSVPVAQISDAIWSTYVTGAAASTYAEILNPDGRVKVELPSGASGLTDTELRASSVPVAQVSDAVWSTNVTNTVAVSGTLTSTGAYLLDGDGTYRGTLPVQGTVAISGITASVGATILNGEGLARDTWGATQVGTWNVGTVTSVTNSVAAALVDSSGVQYSSSNPLPIDDAGGSITIDGTVSVTGSITSTVVVGDTASDAADSGSAPVKIGGIARQANPTAVAAGDRVSATFDDVGRQVFRPHQVRDLIATAYVTLTNGTETTLLAGAASTYQDLIYVMCANQSDAATYVDLRCGTAGSVIKTIQIPASGTAGGSLPTPLPMSEVAQAWTADMPDITGTTIDITALFTKEV